MLVWAHWVGWRKSSEVCFAGERLIKARPMAYSYILVRRMSEVELSGLQMKGRHRSFLASLGVLTPQLHETPPVSRGESFDELMQLCNARMAVSGPPYVEHSGRGSAGRYCCTMTHRGAS